MHSCVWISPASGTSNKLRRALQTDCKTEEVKRKIAVHQRQDSKMTPILFSSECPKTKQNIGPGNLGNSSLSKLIILQTQTSMFENKNLINSHILGSKRVMQQQSPWEERIIHFSISVWHDKRAHAMTQLLLFNEMPQLVRRVNNAKTCWIVSVMNFSVTD